MPEIEFTDANGQKLKMKIRRWVDARWFCFVDHWNRVQVVLPTSSLPSLIEALKKFQEQEGGK